MLRTLYKRLDVRRINHQLCYKNRCRHFMPYQEDIIKSTISKLEEIGAKCGGVKSLESDYASYFDELGIRVNLLPDCPDDIFESVATSMLIYLNTHFPKERGTFKWSLTFWESLVQRGLFYPGDTVTDSS